MTGSFFYWYQCDNDKVWGMLLIVRDAEQK